MPDLLILNGKLLTMDPRLPRAEALAVRGNRIVAVGTRAAAEAAAPGARVIDAGGATVMPGMTEAHLHLFPGAFGLRLLQLEGVRGHDALAPCLRGYAARNAAETLLICKGADYNLFGDGVQTTRTMLDAILPDRPVILFAMDHHTAWANTAALERAGLLHGRALPPGNEVVMGFDGQAEGELREFAAFEPVMALRSAGGREDLGLAGGIEPSGVTPAQRAEDVAVLKEGLKLCASYGFTSLHNMDGNFYQLELLEQIEAEGALICRTEVPFHLSPEKPLETLAEAVEMDRRWRGERLRSGRVKMFMDGVIDSGIAVMVEDYADRSGWKGEPLHDAERFAAACIEADRHGLQIAVHAIGDGAVRRVLDGYAAARAANGPRDSRHRIEHIELLHPDDLPRMVDLGVVASMQPSHPPGAMDFPLHPWTERVGEKRWPWAFPVRALHAAGVPVVFASDWPVADIDPMRSVKAAVTRKPWQEGHPGHASTLMEALHGYTLAGAFAGHDEQRLGSLTPGKLADIVVMDHDLESSPIEEIDLARAAVTIMDGEITWES